jgi:type II secretory pathway component PulF
MRRGILLVLLLVLVLVLLLLLVLLPPFVTVLQPLLRALAAVRTWALALQRIAWRQHERVGIRGTLVCLGGLRALDSRCRCRRINHFRIQIIFRFELRRRQQGRRDERVIRGVFAHWLVLIC